MRTIGITLVLAAACAAATPALAGEVKLAWHDLDLSTEAGKATLDQRIDVAAQAICTPKIVTGSRLPPKPSAGCLSEARDSIAAQITARVDRSRLAAGSGSAASAGARR